MLAGDAFGCGQQRAADARRAPILRHNEGHDLGDSSGYLERVVRALVDGDHGVSDQATLGVRGGQVRRTLRQQSAVPPPAARPRGIEVFHRRSVVGDLAMVTMQLALQRRQIGEAIRVGPGVAGLGLH
jgi:hypothetical protein